MQIKGFTLENSEKAKRAIEGTLMREGGLVGGVGEDASDELKLAVYDRLGGYITKDSRKVKNGCFYDALKTKEATRKSGELTVIPVEKPKIIFLITANGRTVELKEGEKLSPELEAAEIVQKEEKEERKKLVKEKEDKVKKNKKKAKVRI